MTTALFILNIAVLQGCAGDTSESVDFSQEEVHPFNHVATDLIYVTIWCTEGGVQPPVEMNCTSFVSDTTGFRCYSSAEHNDSTFIGAVVPPDGCIISAAELALP